MLTTEAIKPVINKINPVVTEVVPNVVVNIEVSNAISTDVPVNQSFTLEAYQAIIDAKGKFTNQQITYAANKPEYEELVIQGLLPYITTIVHTQCSNKRNFFGMGTYETEADLIGDSLERALICMRRFKPKENADTYAFYNYMSTALDHAIVQKINREYRALFRGKSNCWVKAKDVPTQVALDDDGNVHELEEVEEDEKDEKDEKQKERKPHYMPFRTILKRNHTEDEENLLDNDDGAEQIVDVERKIMFDGVAFKASEIRMLINSYIKKASDWGMLTPKEHEVISCLLDNFEEPDKVIAEKLNISKQRVEQYRKKIAAKLNKVVMREHAL